MGNLSLQYKVMILNISMISLLLLVVNEEQRVNDIIILSNSVPIAVEEQVVGAVISFRDRTEINRLALALSLDKLKLVSGEISLKME